MNSFEGLALITMGKRLKIHLLPNWMDQSRNNPGGPPTFTRANSADSGALQISFAAEYRGRQVPNPSAQDLIGLARRHGENWGIGELIETTSGSCTLGKFGSAVFRSSKCPRVQLWCLSNGYDFVLATHVCCVDPDPAEVGEAQDIVSMVDLS